jgi:hypothetical protein
VTVPADCCRHARSHRGAGSQWAGVTNFRFWPGLCGNTSPRPLKNKMRSPVQARCP